LHRLLQTDILPEISVAIGSTNDYGKIRAVDAKRERHKTITSNSRQIFSCDTKFDVQNTQILTKYEVVIEVVAFLKIKQFKRSSPISRPTNCENSHFDRKLEYGIV
jgi:hypothetical protein